jgi:XTP/dITP diphosphohydrolase
VLATANPHKVAELRAIFARAGVQVVGLADLPGGPAVFHEPIEHGATFEANAEIKALAYAAQTGRVCLADDSGLEIDALQGRPGVISSHYSTDGQETGLSRADRDAANNTRILNELEGVPSERRSARFVCCMALATPPGHTRPGTILHRSRGVFEGRIGIPPRVPAGEDGFGYDPLFLVAPAFERTGAELPTDEKNRLSHRARAALAMEEWISNDRNSVERRG